MFQEHGDGELRDGVGGHMGVGALLDRMASEGFHGLYSSWLWCRDEVTPGPWHTDQDPDQICSSRPERALLARPLTPSTPIHPRPFAFLGRPRSQWPQRRHRSLQRFLIGPLVMVLQTAEHPEPSRDALINTINYPCYYSITICLFLCQDPLPRGASKPEEFCLVFICPALSTLIKCRGSLGQGSWF